MQRFFLFIVFISLFMVSAAQTVETDTHVVKKGETLYSLSQKYNTTVSRLLDLNPAIVNNNLQTGSSIKVPLLQEDVSYKKVKIGPPQYLIPVTYTVDKGETIYSISKKVNNNIETLRMWNDMKTDKIKAGQKLIIGYTNSDEGKVNNKMIVDATVKNSTNTTTVTEKVTPKKEDEKKSVTESKKNETPSQVKDKTIVIKENKKTLNTENVPGTVVAPQVKNDTNDTDKKNTTTVTPPESPTSTNSITTPTSVNKSLNPADGKLVYITEKGVATWTKSNNDDGQFYALHPTALSGTVITVKNIMNNKTIQVKVIGKLPNTADNQNVMIKLSYSAAKELNVLDDKFLATINYMGYKQVSEAMK